MAIGPQTGMTLGRTGAGVSTTNSYRELAQRYCETAQWKDALAACEQALSINPKDARIYQIQGDALAGLENWEKAVEAYSKGLVIKPESTDLRHSIAVVLSRLERVTEADHHYAYIFSERPNFESENTHDFSVQRQTADYFFRLQQWERAVSAYQRAIKLNPYSVWEYINLGRSLHELDRSAEAIETLKNAIAVDKENSWTYYHLGEILFKQNQHSEALELAQQSLRLVPNSGSASLAAKIYTATLPLDQGLLETAVADTDQESEGSRLPLVLPGWEDSYELGKHLQLEGNLQVAAEAYMLSIVKNSQFFKSYRRLGDIRLKMADWAGAIAAYKQTLHLNPDPALSRQVQSISSLLDKPKAKTRKFADREAEEKDLSGSEAAKRVLPGWLESYELGQRVERKDNSEAARIAYELTILRNPQFAGAYHNLGDIHLKQGSWGSAIAAYQQAITLNPDYLWTSYNLGVAYRHIEAWQHCITLYQRAIALNPGITLLTRGLEEALTAWYDKLVVRGDRALQSSKDKGLNLYRQAVEIYRDNLPVAAFELPRELPRELPTGSTEESVEGERSQLSVLLIVDAHLPQCLRYRVEQKIEQLELAGFEATYYAWDDAAEAQRQIAFSDIVIFYRTPAFPNIIKSILYAKAVKKVVFYEIDDLIFDPKVFPEPIESYGGLVSQEQYNGLVKGTVLFQEAMRLCDIAIASTPPLVERMEQVVGKGRVYLHRNALDSKNAASIEIGTPKVPRDYVSIFYGSGTKAHNSDFDELVAPVLIRLFDKYPQVRLTLMGYLTLPKILEPYLEQIDRVDLVKDVVIYYEFLRQADIAIAVLHSTTVNDCKSELKWFEAASYKIPAVVSNTKVYLETIEQEKDGFVAGSQEEWFTYLDRLVADEALRKQVGGTAYARVQAQYSVPTMANNIRSIITAGIERSRAAGNIIPASDTDATARKKLLIVNVFYAPQSIGGATRIVEDNVDVLMAQYSDEYDISILTTDNGNPEAYQIIEYTHEGVPVTQISTPMMVGMDWQYRNPEIYDLFTDYLEFNRPDLIHFHCIQRLTASVLEAAADQGVPYIVTAHDAWWISDYQFLVNENGEECSYQQNDPVVTAQDTHNVTESIQRKIYLREQLNNASEILAVSETFAELYRQNGFPKTKANRNGIQPQPTVAKQPSKSGRVRLAHIGGVAAHKGYFLFKEAVELSKLSNTEIIVINHAQQTGTVTYDDWNGTPVTFLPKFKQADISQLYSMIDVLVAPSMWPESFGLVTREAAAAGVWVVTSDKGAIGEDIIHGENGFICSVEDTQPLVETLRNIDTNHNRYLTESGNIGRVRTTQSQVKELVAFYTQSLANIPAPSSSVSED